MSLVSPVKNQGLDVSFQGVGQCQYFEMDGGTWIITKLLRGNLPESLIRAETVMMNLSIFQVNGLGNGCWWGK